MNDTSSSAEQAGRAAEDSAWLDHAVRAGLVAYGVVHLLIGWLAVQLAFGDSGQEASTQGAMAELASKPFGGTLVWAVALGMFLLVVWRLLEAGFGHRQEPETSDRRRKQAVSLLKAVIYGAIGVTAVRVAAGASSGSGSGSTAGLMGLPAGRWIVVAVGLGVIAYGVNTARRGWTEKFTEHLDLEGRTGNDGSAYLIFGKAGYIAKGIALTIVGGLFVYAGITHDPQRQAGLDDALRTVLEQPFGPYLLLAMGVGIACYGLFCFARAKHLDR